MSNILEISNLCKSFGSFALKDIGFTLPAGYIMGFIGPNGAGKTTVIKLILNMLHKDGGKINVFGLDHIEREEDIKEYMGVVFDQTYYLPNWTLRDVEKSMRLFYKTWDTGKFSSYLGAFGLQPNLKVGKLSKGMKMKLMIAVALSHDTRLLILDEPTGGLDAISRNELMDLLGSYVLSEDKSILFSTHTTSDLERIADYITYINNGELVYTGTKDLLLESWCVVKGSLDDAELASKAGIKGLTVHQNWFEGVMPVSCLKGLAPGIVAEPASLDDIIIFTSRREKDNG